MTVAAEPAHVAAVEVDHEPLGLVAPIGKPLDSLEQESRTDRLALTEEIDLDEPDVQPQLDCGIFDRCQRRFGPGQVVDESLDQLAYSRVGQLLGIWVLREKLLDLWRRLKERLVGPEAILGESPPKCSKVCRNWNTPSPSMA